jgi:hypothetical protein
MSFLLGFTDGLELGLEHGISNWLGWIETSVRAKVISNGLELGVLLGFPDGLELGSEQGLELGVQAGYLPWIELEVLLSRIDWDLVSRWASLADCNLGNCWDLRIDWTWVLAGNLQ